MKVKFIVFALLLIGIPLPAQDPTKSDVEVKASGEFDRSESPLRKVPGLLVWRKLDYAQQRLGKEADGILCQVLKVKKIDWDNDMIVVICGGQVPSGGYSITLEKLKLAPDTRDKKSTLLEVYWKLNAPEPGVITTQALANPCLVFLCKKHTLGLVVSRKK